MREEETHLENFALPDPRGHVELQRLGPAGRHALLQGRKILLVDNGKLATRYRALSHVGQVLLDLFSGLDWATFSRDFLRYQPPQAGDLADQIVASQPDVVVLAIADSGVGVQTALVAIELERRGIPTVILATPLGGPACAAIAQSQLPELPVVIVDIVRADTFETVRERMTAVRADIEAALTEPPRPPAAPGGDADDLIFVPKCHGWSAAHEFQDWLEQHGLGDGLPLLAPTPDVVRALLATVPAAADEVIYLRAPTSGRSLRVQDIATNAAMTGCPERAFPVVLAALRAMAQPDFRLLQAAMTTHPAGYFVLLSGCDPARFGLSGGPGCLGPGHRGNLTVGRAVSLTVQHLFGAKPGGADLTTFGSPVEISFCMGEQTGNLPWPPLAQDFGFDGPAVLVLKVEAPRNVMEDTNVTPTGLCEAIAAGAVSTCANNAYVPGNLAVLLNPEHAKIFTEAGWRRGDLAEAIHHRATLPRTALEGRGLVPIRPAYMDGLADIPVTRSAQDVFIAIGGAPGPHSCVALPWGPSRAQWMKIAAHETRY